MGSSLVSVAQHLDWISECQLCFYRLTLAFAVICVMQMGLEVALIVVSCRGSILQDHKRWPAEYLLYTKLGKCIGYYHVTQGGSKLPSIEGVQEEKVKQAVSNNMVQVNYLLTRGHRQLCLSR